MVDKTRRFNLLQSEVFEASALGLKAAMAILLRQIIDASPDRAAAAASMQTIMEGLIRSIGAPASVPDKRKDEYLRCAIDQARTMVDQAVSLGKAYGTSTRH